MMNWKLRITIEFQGVVFFYCLLFLTVVIYVLFSLSETIGRLQGSFEPSFIIIRVIFIYTIVTKCFDVFSLFGGLFNRNYFGK